MTDDTNQNPEKPESVPQNGENERPTSDEFEAIVPPPTPENYPNVEMPDAFGTTGTSEQPHMNVGSPEHDFKAQTATPTDDTPQPAEGTSSETGASVDDISAFKEALGKDAPSNADTQDDAKEKKYAHTNLQNLFFYRVERQYYENLERVFVESAKFTAFFDEFDGASARRDYKMYFICGERNTGRYATALHLALKLTGDNSDPQIYEYVPEAATTTLSLFDIVRRAIDSVKPIGDDKVADQDTTSQKLPQGSILIIRDIFDEAGGKIREISEQYVKRLKWMLSQHKITLILTTTYRVKDYPDLGKFLVYETTDEHGNLHVELDKIYAKFLDRNYPEAISIYSEDREQIKRIAPIILKQVKRPSEIENFFRRAQSNIPQSNEEAEKLIKEIVGEEKRRTQTRPWFENLTLNQKLYAMFVVLFRGLSQHDLDELYDLSIAHLRDSMVDEYWLHDTRPISDEKFHEVLLLKRRREVLEFNVARPQEYIEEIERQVVNHHRLLWGLIDLLGNLIRQSRYYDVQIRRLIATAIGQIGEFRKNRLETVLNDLASHPQGHVASSVSFTLSYLARNVNNHPFILDILGDWIKSKKYDYLWAAIVAISPIYEVISQIATRSASSDATVLSEARVAQNTLTELQKWLTEACVTTNNLDTSELEKTTRQTIIQAVQKTLQETPEDEVPSPAELKKLVDQEVSKRVTVRKMAMADQLGMAIVRTIQQISQNSPDDMVNLLNEWLTRETSTLDWQLGRMTINYLFQMTVESQVRVIEERHLQLLGLLPAMLDASINIGTDMNKILITLLLGDIMAEENIHHHSAEMLRLINETPIRTAVKTLAIWYEYLHITDEVGIETQDNIWRAQIYPALLHLVNVSNQKTRPMLIDALITFWLDCPHDEVRRSAMALLTRCYIMDGVVLTLPVQQYGVVLVDAGQSANDHYYEWIFDILQRLATLTPLRIYHLGWIGRWQVADEKPFANSTPLHLGRFEAESVDFGTISKDDLKRDFSRPRLLMPLIHNPSPNFLPITAKASHFILSLNRGDIHDLPEFVDSLLDNMEAPKEYNPFLQALQVSKDKDTDKSPAPQATWEWFGKLFLLGNPSPLLEKLPVGALQWLGVPKEFNTVVARNIELRVQQQIITELHAIDTKVWHKQLAEYRHKEHDIPLQADQNVSQADQDALWLKLDEWVTQLDVIPETIPPRDVTLTIGSTILLWSRIDLIKTTEKVCQWLTSGDPAKTQIGKACTKILFNFYRQGANWDNVQELSPLLTLFPPFMELAPGFAEFNGIIQTMLDWAKNKRWSERLLVTDDGATSEFIRGIAYIEDRDDADRTMNQLIVRETLLRLQTLFIDVGAGFLQFIELVNETIRWAMEEQERRQRAIQQAQNTARSGGRGRRSNIQPKPVIMKYQPSAPPKGISSDFANELLELPNLNEQFRDAVLAEILNQEDWLLSHRKEHREIRVNVQTVLDSIRLQLYSKRDGDLPPLPKDKDVAYGVVLLDVSGRDYSMRERLPNFAIRLLGGILSEANGKVLNIVHRLGRQEMVAILEPKARKTTLKPDDLLPKGLPYYAPIIGPILERYTPDQTQFVAIITNKPLADWQDFVDDDTWAGRLFVISEQSFPMPMGIERLPIPSEDAQKDQFKEIAKDILRKTTRRNS